MPQQLSPTAGVSSRPFSRLERRAFRALSLLFLSSVWFPPTLFAAAPQKVHISTTPVVARLKPVGRLSGSRHLRLAISLPLRNQRALTGFLAQLQEPASPNYHKYLTPAQFAERFGPAEADYQAVIAFARAHGLTVTGRHPNRVILDVDGAVSDIEKALHVTLRSYQHPREPRQFYAPDADPAVDLGAPIMHISGLDDYELPRPRLRMKPLGGPVNAATFNPRAGVSVHPVPAGRNGAPNTGSGPGSGYMGDDFRAAYAPGVTLAGSGQAVGLVQFDGYTASDITYYEKLAGRSNITLTNVLLDGFDGAPTGNGGEVEVSLDIEMVISMCPCVSNIFVYEAGPDGAWEDVLNRIATDDAANQLSCSWYSPGAPADPVADCIFQEMAAQGQSFFCASGDSDAYTGLIPFPGDTPYITEVGGSTLTTGSAGGPYSSETVWNWNNGTGSGGGISTQYALPVWQEGIDMSANLGSTTMRNVPDVAMTADGVYVRADGEDWSAAGTSCAAPLWAGFTALANERAMANGRGALGFVNPAIYALCTGTGYAAAIHDIAVGNNFSPSSPAQFPAKTGYDLCTGWGSPNGIGLIDALAGAPTPYLTTGNPLPNGAAGMAYSEALAASGGAPPYTWRISAGALPSGLSLSGSGGVISGTPSATGAATFTVEVTDTNGAFSATALTLAIYARGTPVIVTGSPLPTGTMGEPYTETLAAGGGATPYTWSIVSGSPPPGVSLSDAGLLSGTPSVTGSFAFTVQVSGSDGLFSATPFVLIVPPPPVIDSAASATGTNWAPFSYQITATNRPGSYGAAGLPPGLSVNAATGLISGTVMATGTSTVTLEAFNAGGAGSATLLIAVAQMPPPVIMRPFASLCSFTGGNGANPIGALTQGWDGNFYGTTEGGGYGLGTVFQMTPGGSLTTLGIFDFGNGYAPFGGLVQATDGNLYGTTAAGGFDNDGTVFQVTTTGSLTSLYSFANSDGSFPTGALAQASDGNLYGTTRYGGSNGDGTVFRMSLGGPLTTLVTFDYSNGYSPTDGLLQAADGNFYGTTQGGGTYGDGTAFGMNLSGSLTTLANFTGSNGNDPVAGLAQGNDGNLYGTTYYGGDGNDGAVFMMTLSGSLTTLYSFGGTDGANPLGGLVQAGDGQFYGTTYDGGTNGDGALFMVTSSGSLTTLCSFNGANGAYPQSGLVKGSNGVLYGATSGGGSADQGTIFSLTPFSVTPAVGTPFRYQITAVSNAPPAYCATNLPAGLSLDGTTGIISGTPTTIGTSNVTISATNAGGTGSANLDIIVTAARPAITGAPSATGTSGLPFAYQIAATNNPTLYRISALPAGLHLNTATGLISGVATAPGATSAIISASNAGGVGSAALSIVIAPMSFTSWQNVWFTPGQLANPAISGDTATPAGDGIPNLLKYALNLNPMGNGVSGLPQGSMMSSGGNDYLTLSYTQVISASDIDYIPEVSGDMQTWNSGVLYVAQVSVTPNADGVTETVVVQDLTPAGAGAPRFIRLRVTGP